MMITGARTSPFRSLDFFTRADAALFAGREDEIEEVATRIVSGDTLVVYGPSGVGKTSLLCAGVVPALEKRRGYRVTYVRPLLSPRGDVWSAVGADPAEPLAAALTRLSVHADDAGDAIEVAAAGSLTLSDPAIQIAPDRRSARSRAICAPHVLILDQLEELFTRFDEPQRRPLWDGLVEVLDSPDAPVRLVLSLREEYLHFLDSAHPRLPNLLDRRFRLRGLAPFGARTAIVRPLIARRTRYEPELVDRCVADLTEVPTGHAEEDGVVDPLLLQIVCSEVYRSAAQRGAGAPSLTLAGYTELGGPAGVFRRHLDELFHRVDAGDRLLLQLVLQEMTTAHATKLPTTISRLARSGLAVSATELQGILDKLVAASLVRRYAAEPEPWYELVHDRLVQALPDHFARDQKFLRLRYMRELVGQLSKGFSDGMIGAPLLNRQQLADLVEPFRRYVRFSEPELSLLFRSAVAIEHNAAAWRDAFEAAAPGKWRGVLLDLLSQPETRRGAVAAVGVLGVTDPPHLARCVDTALHDNDPAMASAASTTLCAVAGAEEARALAAALRDRAVRPRALWLLAELIDNPAVQAQIPPRVLGAARREHERRRLLEVWDAVQHGGRAGIRMGLPTSAASGLAAIAAWCVALLWLGRVDLGPYATGAGVIAVTAAVIGVCTGYSTGRALAKLQALDRPPTWFAALRDRVVLGTLAGALAFGVVAIAFVLRATSDALAISPPEAEPHIGLVVTALGASAPSVILASISLIAWTLPRARWHGTRGPIAVATRAAALSWLFALGIGALLIALGGGLGQDRQVVVVAIAMLGTWCSICAASVARVLAEPIWKQAQARPAIVRSALRPVPAGALAVAVAALLWRTPLPPWAPVVDVGDGGDVAGAAVAVDGHPPPAGRARLRDLPASWLSGRWVRLRNRSDAPRIIALHPAGSSAGPEDLLVVWPGTSTQWLSSGVDQVYALRQVDLDRERAATCSYAVTELKNLSQWSWKKRVYLGVQADRVMVQRIGCRAALTDHTAACYDGHGARTGCELDSATTSSLRPERYEGQIIDLECTIDVPDSEVNRMEMVIFFEPVKGHCTW